ASGAGTKEEAEAIRIQLVSHETRNVDAMRIVLESGDSAARLALAMYGPLKIEVAELIYVDHDPELARLFVSRLHPPGAVISLFRKHHDPVVRAALAANPHVRGRTLMRLAADPNPTVARAARANPYYIPSWMGKSVRQLFN